MTLKVPAEDTSGNSFLPIASRTFLADSHLLGIPETTGVFLLEAERPTLIETSASAVTPRILEALSNHGVDELAYIVVTHIHLDHAGAAGRLAQEFPEATVVVHEQGARHMADPSRLESSAARVYGEENLFTNWGHLEPIESERIRSVDDGETIDLGDRSLEVIYAPGHARHQVALADSETGGIFLGDAAGIYIAENDYQTPSAPPPDLDPELAVESLKRIAERDPEIIFFTHYGPGNEPQRLLAQASEQYIKWGEIASASVQLGGDVDEIAARFRTEGDPERVNLPEEVRARLERISSYETSAAGYMRHLELRGHTREPVGGEADVHDQGRGQGH